MDPEPGSVHPRARFSLYAGLAGWVLLLAGLVLGMMGVMAALFTLLVLAYAAAGAALWGGWTARRDIDEGAGLFLGKGLAITGLVLGIVFLGGFLVLPLLLILLACLCSSPSSSSGSSCDCGGCDCGGCDCGGCDCGGCDCATGPCVDCGGCGCIAPVAPLAVIAAAHAPRGQLRLRHAFAHHPDTPAFREDVYRVRGARLCVGCFTAYPAFLLAAAALTLAAPPVAWWALASGGAALASAQAISSAGLARKRWMKASVKTLLGAGLALVLHGVLTSPLPKAAQAALLLAAMGLAFASAIPRARRMREAARAQSSTRTP